VAVGLLAVAILALVWCIWRLTDRHVAQHADDQVTLIRVRDKSETEHDDKLAGAHLLMQSGSQISYGYVTERKMATSAQLFHYQLQKQRLIALEQSAQNEAPTTSRSGTIRRHDSREPKRWTMASATASSTYEATNGHDNSTTVTTVDTLSDAEARQRTVDDNSDDDDEETAVLEYPGLVTTMEHLEIGNPIFEAPRPRQAGNVDGGATTYPRLESTTGSRL
jgi:hypothetical protein